MAGKTIRYLLIIGLLILVGYNSIYFKKLDVYKAENTEKQFDAGSFADAYLQKLAPVIKSSIDIDSLHVLLSGSPAKAFDKYSNALGIGNIKYFLTQGKATVMAVNESSIKIETQDSSRFPLTIATEYVYGNAIRDASGLISLNDFTSTSDLNNVSAAINKKIREQLLPAFKAAVKPGDTIAFEGAFELNKQHPDLQHIEIIPVNLRVLHP